MARAEAADQDAHGRVLEVAALREVGVTTHLDLAQALTERGVRTPRGSRTWTHTTIMRLLARVGMERSAADPP